MKTTLNISIGKLIAWAIVTVVVVSVIFIILPKSIHIEDIKDVHQPNRLMITPEIIKAITNVVTRQTSIVAIQIVSINFQRNVRVETFTLIGDPAVQQIYDAYLRTRSIESPLFTDDREKNARLMKLIEGSFVCVPFSQSSAYSRMPTPAGQIKTICGIGIPPEYFREFSGILSIYLSVVPTAQQINELFLYARELSITIHEYNKAQNEHSNQFRLELR